MGNTWMDACVSGYLLALFVSSRGAKVHSWVMYELGMSIIASCKYDNALFFALFGITPSQIAYVFFSLSHTVMWPHHIGNMWNPPAAHAILGLQVDEGGWGQGGSGGFADFS